MTFTFRAKLKENGKIQLPLGDRQFEKIEDGDWVWIHAHKIHQPGDGFADQVVENMKELVSEYQAGNYDNYTEIARKLTDFVLNEKGMLKDILEKFQAKQAARQQQPAPQPADSSQAQMIMTMMAEQSKQQQHMVQMMMEKAGRDQQMQMEMVARQTEVLRSALFPQSEPTSPTDVIRGMKWSDLEEILTDFGFKVVKTSSHAEEE